MRTPATDIAGEKRRSVIPKVDLLDDSGERGPKTMSKKTNLSVLWDPHPTYDGEDINPTIKVNKSKAVVLVESESENWSKKSVEPYPHFFRAGFFSGGKNKMDDVRPEGAIRMKQTAKVLNSLNERGETTVTGLKRRGGVKVDIARDEEEIFEEVGYLSPEFSGEPQSDPATPSQQVRPGDTRNPVIITEEGAHLEVAIPSEADIWLVQVYGDHVHQNDGCHMNGAIADDNVWQMWL